MTLGHATSLIRRLERAEPARRRRIFTTSLLMLLPALAAIPLAAVGRWGSGIFDEMIELDLLLLVPLLPAIVLGPAIADEIERGTAGFLFVRPVPRVALLLGRLAAVLPLLLGMATIGLALAFGVLYVKFPDELPRALPHFAASVCAVAGGLCLYSLLSLGLGATFRKRPVAALLVVIFADAIIARLPLGLQLLSPAHHLRMLAGLPGLSSWTPPFALPRIASAAYLVVLIVVAAAFGASRMNRIEISGES